MQKEYVSRKDKTLMIKEKIFDIAVSLMKQVGFENLTVRAICLNANVSNGMFYRLFGSKDNLLNFYYEKCQVDFNKDLQELILEKNIEEQLLTFYKWLYTWTEDLGVDFCKNFFSSKNEVMNTTVFHNKCIAITDELLENAVAHGFVISNKRTPHRVSTDLCIIMKGIIFDWSANNGNYNLPEYTEQMMRMCMKGVL